MNGKIIIWTHGGLGNQLFQYTAFLFFKSLNPNTFLELNCLEHTKSEKCVFLQDLIEIDDSFVTNYRVSIIRYIINKFLSLSRLCYSSLFNKTFNVKGLRFMSYKDDNRDINYILKNKLTYTKYNYWQQNEIIFRDENHIKNSIRFRLNRTETDPKFKELLQKVSRGISVGIHVRGGDYIEQGWLLPAEYYLNAISYVKNIENQVEIFLMTDDIRLANSILSSIKCKYTLISNDNQDAIKDLLIFMNCKYNIISNSTFSWWGGYLNKNNKNVIAPKNWILSNTLEYRIYMPKNWIKMDY